MTAPLLFSAGYATGLALEPFLDVVNPCDL